jgi:hypothetical protein
LRAFPENEQSDKAAFVVGVDLALGPAALIDAAEQNANVAARAAKPLVFCPPTAVFRDKRGARESDLVCGPVLSAELDTNPQAARVTLETLLGPATVVVQSGGEWIDPATGEIQSKQHCHWRLKTPARDGELAKLKQARVMTARLVGGDPTNAPVVHPIRWPGSWHRKGAPKLCQIQTVNPDAELELDEALEMLSMAMPPPDSSGNGHDRAGSFAGGSDWDGLIGAIHEGADLHASTTILAMKLLRAGMSDPAALNLLRAHMHTSRAPRNERWQARFDDLARAVRTAREKIDRESPWPGPQQPQPSLALPLHWHGDPDTVVERRMLIKDLLPEVGVGVLAGQFGLYKSFIALDLAVAVISGTFFIDYPVARKGGVLFVAAEGADEVGIRLQAAVEHRCGGNRVPFAWVTSCPSLLDRDAVAILVATANEASKRMKEQFQVSLVLIIVDTIMAATTFAKAGDENDAVVMRRVMKQLERLGERTTSLALAIDHFGKDISTGVRGSSVKETGPSVLAVLGTRSEAGQVSETRLAVRKVRSGASGREIPFDVDPKEVVVTPDGKTETTLVITWAPGQPVAQPKTATKDRGGWPKHLLLLRTTLMKVLGTDKAMYHEPIADGPTVRAIDIELVAAEFCRAKYTGDPGGEAKQASKRRTFKRQISEAQNLGLVGVDESEGKTPLVWLTKPEARTGFWPPPDPPQNA